MGRAFVFNSIHLLEPHTTGDWKLICITIVYGHLPWTSLLLHSFTSQLCSVQWWQTYVSLAHVSVTGFNFLLLMLPSDLRRGKWSSIWCSICVLWMILAFFSGDPQGDKGMLPEVVRTDEKTERWAKTVGGLLLLWVSGRSAQFIMV